MPVLGTKLHVPSARRELVPRGRLTDRLRGAGGTAPRLVLISAPAGFGKTTLMAQWLSTPTAADGRGPGVAWLSLDEADSDVGRFLTHLVAAIRAARPDVGAEALTLLEAGGDELDERLGAALRAKTYGDLELLVADLSADLPWRPHRWPAQPAMPAYGPPPPGFSREDPLRLDGGMSSDKRVGTWTVPPFLRISSGAGSVKLNCLQATAAAPMIEVEVIAGVGSVVIIVPDGWAANDDRLGKSMGSKTIKVPRTPAPGHPLLVLYGSVGLGSFKVRPPSRWELRKLARAARG